jgi:hypothetical protein
LEGVKCGVINIDGINTETFTPLDAWSLIYDPLIKEVILPNIGDPDIQLEDLRKYHAFRIVAKHSRLPKLEWQWSGNWKTMGIRGSPFIRRVMTKERYWKIHREYHKFDLHKFVNWLNELLEHHWRLFPNISLDDGYPACKCRNAYVLRKQRKTHLYGKLFY